MASPDLTKQYSLDYLISGSVDSKSNEAAPFASANVPAEATASDAVFDVLSRPILRKLDAAPGKTLSLFQLIDQLSDTYDNLEYEAFAEIINRLVSLGRLKILERHRHGDHKIAKA